MSENLCNQCVDAGTCQAGTAGIVTCVQRTADNTVAVRRLAELGIRRGAAVTLGRRTPGGGRIVAVAGSQLALDRRTLGLLHLASA